MKSIQTSRLIEAPLNRVFQTISDARNFCKAIPHITKVEFISEQEVGVGTRFRETRIMNGRTESVELEVTEYVENDRIRLVSDAGGTIWDTVFTVAETSEGVDMKMNMDVTPHTFLARIMNVLIQRMVVKGVESDMDSVKQFCESKGTITEEG